MFSHRFSRRRVAPIIEAFESRRLFSVDVLTAHNDLSRQGLNSNETMLTQANVNTSTFGKKFQLLVDGQIYGQPLVVSGLAFARGHLPTIHRNMVYVTTENDTVYAFDGGRGQLIWSVRTLATTLGETPIPNTDTPTDDINPDIGITGTPVIDRSSNTLYVVSNSKRDTGGTPIYATRLYALDLNTGAKLDGGPVLVGASVPGTGNGSISGVLSYSTILENQRAALTLLNGEIYIAFAGHGDPVTDYHGWVFAYNASTLHQDIAWSATPDGGFGGIWMGGAGFAADSDGNLYFASGNGDFDADQGGDDFGDTLFKVPSSSNPSFTASDFFTPQDQDTDNSTDTDFGSSGPMLFTAPNGHLEAVIGSKEGNIFVLDTASLGGLDVNGTNAVQILPSIGGGKDLNTAAYFNGNVYMSAAGGPLEDLAVQNDGTLSLVGQTASSFVYPGVKPSVSSNGTSDGIVWIDTKIGGLAVLQAYDANDLSNLLYASNLQGKRDRAGSYVKFTTPTIANGEVFLGTGNQLDIYGLL